MPIGAAVQRGANVCVYDEKGHQIGVLHAGSKPTDGLKGYTTQTLSVQRGTTIYIYNDKCRQMRAIAGSAR
jgi:hypothetical protein